MNSYLDRIHHFKGTPHEIGFAAGQMLGDKLEKNIRRDGDERGMFVYINEYKPRPMMRG